MGRGRPRKDSKMPVNKEEDGPSFSKKPVNQEDGLDQDVLDPKPMRTLAPMFPTPLGFHTVTENTTSPPLIRVTPYSPFQPGPESGTSTNPPFTFFPQSFSPPNPVPGPSGVRPTSNGPINATPISSFKTPVPVVNEEEDEEEYFNTHTSTSGRKIKRSSLLSGYSTRGSTEGSHGTTDGPSTQKPKKSKPNQPFTVHDLSLQAPCTGDPREDVEVVLMIFDALRRKLLQLDEIHDAKQRADLKAGSIMTSGNLKANIGKRVGSVPGVHVGDIFFFRMEMCVIGLHAPSMGGIDYMSKYGDEEEPVAICIVSAGGYENDEDDPNILVYTGQGGNGDQKLEKGNLALEKSLHRKNPVRVVRGLKDPSVPAGRIYMYDGLYKIQNSWKDRAKGGFSIFKYKLIRESGQPAGTSVFKMAQRWTENPSLRGQVILPDLSSGVENTPVCLVNEVDGERGPSHFTYATHVQYIKQPNLMSPLPGCKCPGVCLPADPNCTCSHSHGSELPYSSTGLLVGRKTMVYECNPTCQCNAHCRNRVSQKGTKLHFEVFKTENCGWGLRSWDPIRAGTFVCEYTGEVVDEVRVNLDDEEDHYLFKAACPGEKTLKWNFGTELIGEPGMGTGSMEVFKPLPIKISAKNMGNVSRFMNHSCNPNLFWQPVLFDHGDEGHPHIMFFAMKHIPPMTELTFDYGNIGTDEYSSAKRCRCGSVNCRGFFA
ncbi:histone-lysine N-methyltransferase, H3 lysine-9 specific SUVH1-like protein [Carex littledalei]|uniref:Histone-lysine N-methyltransferase, H3 lysine-9 specific SUVH1-like protein n=1 Tax=Carex littledalei TaxID=544730 RepID=A0A833R722_9POAL|nr:histone-lysine N-methyltransferase, H3 lysine-9 specific SUVH1-like protein [Carex littledalei]